MTSIGFHTGPGGNRNGIGEYWQRLHTAGIPFFQKAVDDYGPCFETANIARGGNIPHSIIFRLSTAGQGDGYDYDVPDYSLPPAIAAAEHWYMTKLKLPPEFDKSLVWVEPINEVDKGRADWLGHFAAEIGSLANSQGYKVTLFGWSSGEPEYTDWQTAGMKRYLALCAANPGKVAVSLHEYSYSQNIQNGYPNLVGRFQKLFDACDAMGIGRPTVHITEWGWERATVPEPTAAMVDIDWAYRLYAPYPQVKGVAIWYLGGGWDGIATQAQKLIAPVTDYMLNTPPVDPIEPPPIDPPPPGDTLEERLWNASVTEQIARGITLNPQAALQNAIRAAGRTPVHRETTSEGYTIQAGEDVTGAKPRRVYVWQSGKPIWSFDKPNDPVPPPSDTIDLRLFKISDPDCWRVVRNPQGEQEDVQDMELSGGIFVRRKNHLAEWHKRDNSFFYLIHDTSPAPGIEGVERVYTLYKNGVSGAPKSRVQQAIGVLWTELGTHFVQFRAKDNCRNLSENSGDATNSSLITRYEKNFTFNSYGQNLTFDEVVFEQTGTETQIYGRKDNKSCGWIGWIAPWGSSEPVEIHWNRGRLTVEPNRYCNWT